MDYNSHKDSRFSSRNLHCLPSLEGLQAKPKQTAVLRCNRVCANNGRNNCRGASLRDSRLGAAHSDSSRDSDYNTRIHGDHILDLCIKRLKLQCSLKSHESNTPTNQVKENITKFSLRFPLLSQRGMLTSSVSPTLFTTIVLRSPGRATIRRVLSLLNPVSVLLSFCKQHPP